MSSQIEHTATPPSLVLMRLLCQVWKPQAVHVAAQLHIAELLANGPRTVAELAEVTGTHAPSLYRLLRALSRIGIFAELDGSHFVNNELSQLLRPGVPGSLSMLGAMSMERPAWSELLHSVQTGEPGFDKAYGMPMRQYFLECDPALSAMYNAAMASLSTEVDLPIAQAADLSGVRTVVDVGGGYGGLLSALLATHSSIEKAILFEQPLVINEARTALGPVRDGRVQLIDGDFFTAVPTGADAYVMKWVLHDWDDAACLKIIASCRRAMASHSRLLAVEHVLDSDRDDEFAYFLDLEMLVNLAGKERTAAEFQALYDAAGLHLTRIIPTTSMFSLIEGIPRNNGKDAA
jgi:O-methyltransferase domain